MATKSTFKLFLVSSLVALTLIGCSKGSSLATNGTSDPSETATASPSSGATSSPDSSPVSSESASPESPKPPSPTKELGTVTALRLADFKTGWAGGEGWIARTDDGGATWQPQTYPASTVKQLFALNNREVWATVGAGSPGLELLHSKDGGNNWNNAGTVPNDGFLHFASSNEAFSGNARSTDGGKTWTEYKLPDNTVNNAYFHDRDNGWAVTYDKDKIHFMRTVDGAKSWKSVHEMPTVSPVTEAIIRSAGKNDAWIELVGDSGMSQTSYSLFHTTDGGGKWQPVIANNQAGSGPAPGYKNDAETKVPRNNGAAPGPLYVVDTKTAFMGGFCGPCDLPNTMGKTTDGGKTWTNLKSSFSGYGPQFIAAENAQHVWWVTTDSVEPSVMYTSADGGKTWKKAHTFAKPSPS
ncbi:hypothetical protein D7Z26_14985 [Cohnella endophytica]|uniref:Sortilin N-terminal domain-containing protein n=1 Tax=Cohnella endophytica TaxID=2419778 RepID=A0A494XW85_9BACL|nr:hypothetical protein [Cohnella endophytica]RKP53236.1 hypothetical protein D7Z26_14985 [Cohnella endophytica]